LNAGDPANVAVAWHVALWFRVQRRRRHNPVIGDFVTGIPNNDMTATAVA